MTGWSRAELSRPLVLTAGSVLSSLAPFYLARTFGLGPSAAGAILIGLVAAACLLGATGLAVTALAPALPVALLGAATFGIASGASLAADWALPAQLVPRAAAGRFMGISNVATGLAGVLAFALGGSVTDLVGGPGGILRTPRRARGRRRLGRARRAARSQRAGAAAGLMRGSGRQAVPGTWFGVSGTDRVVASP